MIRCVRQGSSYHPIGRVVLGLEGEHIRANIAERRARAGVACFVEHGLSGDSCADTTEPAP